MPLFCIEMINAHFESSDEGEYPSLDAAVKTALTGATRVASESISDGAASAAVEIRIRQDGRVLAHHVVNLSISEMLPRD